MKLKNKRTNGNYKAKILKDYQISNALILEWKSIIGNEFEKRAKIEGEKISGKKIADEDWDTYFNKMRNK